MYVDIHDVFDKGQLVIVPKNAVVQDPQPQHPRDGDARRSRSLTIHFQAHHQSLTQIMVSLSCMPFHIYVNSNIHLLNRVASAR